MVARADVFLELEELDRDLGPRVEHVVERCRVGTGEVGVVDGLNGLSNREHGSWVRVVGRDAARRHANEKVRESFCTAEPPLVRERA